MQNHQSVKNILLVIVLIFSSFLMLWKLGEGHLTNWDEAWYAGVARTMSEEGNIFSPEWNGALFLEKPPLFYWLTALSYRIFGDSEFSGRFISAVSGVATVGLLFWFTQKKWGIKTALASSLILLSTPAFLWRVRTGNLDSLLTFLIFLSAVTRFAGIAAGFAFLTKGFIGFLYPLVSNIRGLIIGGAIALIWFLLSYFINGELFLQQFFAQQGEKIGSTHFSLDYVFHLKTGLKLWVIVLIPSIILAIREKSLVSISRFILFFLVLLSFLQEKSTWFLHPIYPFIALISGWSLFQIPKRFHTPLLCMVTAVAFFQLYHYRSEYLVPDIAADESRVAIASREYTTKDDIIYLTHYYFPTAVYYSRRKTYAVYSERPSITWWILPKSAWVDILKDDQVFINTSGDDLKELQGQFPKIQFKILFQSGNKILVKKVG